MINKLLLLKTKIKIANLKNHVDFYFAMEKRQNLNSTKNAAKRFSFQKIQNKRYQKMTLDISVCLK